MDSVEEHGAPINEEAEQTARELERLEAMRHYADRVLTDCPDQDWDLFLRALQLEMAEAKDRMGAFEKRRRTVATNPATRATGAVA